MLVLSRHRGEALILANGTIKITVVEVRGSIVRLGVQAPEEVSIDREEIWLKKATERHAPKP